MDHVRLEEVSKFYGSVRAVDSVTLSIERGERVALLGPSGCGKTTTLNLVAGFVAPDAGTIRIGERDMGGIPPNKRNIGMVFQSYALFPHLTVAENVAFGLKLRRVDKAQQRRRVAEGLEMVRLVEHADRYPRQLSGGQQQRVSLARALVVKPEIMLFDEPLSNLDAKLREEMRTELLEIQERVKITSIYVTHDQEEALALADRVAVMTDGRIEQVGTPDEVYESPATAFVAKFLGESNVLPATVSGVNGSLVDCDAGPVCIRSRPRGRFAVGDRVEVIVRTERILISPEPLALDNCFRAQLSHVVYLGGNIRYLMELGGHRIISVERNRGDHGTLREGTDVHVGWSARDSLLVMPG
jgi:putative spermidine/putrescine transport system ATP-binding protein